MKKDMKKLFLTIVAAAFLVSCNTGPVADVAVFEEVSPGQSAYKTRMIASKDFLRIDDGNDVGDFLLYDRKKKSVHNVNSQEQLILNISSISVAVDSPIKLDHKIVKKDTDAPMLAGSKVKNFLFITNKQVCFDVHSADGMLPVLQQALAEYRRALSGEQAMMLSVTPAEMLNGCDLANNIYLPDRHLGKGFPVSQKEYTGRSRLLLDYKENKSINPQLFVLPSGYRQISPQDMRSEKKAG